MNHTGLPGRLTEDRRKENENRSMYERVKSAGLRGIDGVLVDVEVNISNGLPCMEFTGMPGTEVREAGERVKAALHHAGIGLPAQRITLNLSPADFRKVGSAYDLPIAAVMLKALGELPSLPDDLLLLGELGLDGTVRPVKGVLPILLYAKENGITACAVPRKNAAEAALVDGMRVYAMNDLSELKRIGADEGLVFRDAGSCCGTVPERKDMRDIAGQEGLKRAVLTAAAGMHHLLMTGPPGSGKTMAAERIPGILPELTAEEKLELTKIYSVRGMLDPQRPMIETRPFRTVHDRMTLPALLGGGRIAQPGEITLAHHGVLFLDEAPEFARSALEALRTCMESGEIVLNRLHGSCRYPARFMLVAAANPCPCGCYPDPDRCTCTPAQIRQYQRKISGPLLDRIDLQVSVERVDYRSIARTARAGDAGKETMDSAKMRALVEAAAERQKYRFRGEQFRFNSEIPSGKIGRYCQMTKDAEQMLGQAYESLGLTARGYHRILKTARTIADLDGAERIGAEHISEALSYRRGEDRWA